MAPRPKSTEATPILDLTELVRKRDAFVTSMTMLRTAADEASRTALAYFDAIAINGPGINGGFARGISVGPHGLDEEETGGKRKRKRTVKPKDPNAPKKPATPFLLFCQTGRETVKKDLGPTASYQQVQEELRNRWDKTPDKNAWSELYQQKLSDWKTEKAEYDANKAIADGASIAPVDSSSAVQARAGGFTAVNHAARPAVEDAEEDEEVVDEEEEEDEAEEAPAAAATTTAAAAVEEDDEEEAAADEEDEEEAESSLSPPPVKVKGKPGRKPKTPIKVPEAVPAPSTEKIKKKPGRKPKNAQPEPTAQLEAEAAEAEGTPKKRPRKRRKSGTE